KTFFPRAEDRPREPAPGLTVGRARAQAIGTARENELLVIESSGEGAPAQVSDALAGTGRTDVPVDPAAAIGFVATACFGTSTERFGKLAGAIEWCVRRNESHTGTSRNCSDMRDLTRERVERDFCKVQRKPSVAN